MARKHNNISEDEEMRKYYCKRAPKGHFVVYVGKEMKRFVIPISYLKNSIFQTLLDKAAEEYGFDTNNAIVLPCDESTFYEVTALSSSNN
ncbi:hypothetical protein CsatB_001668 [Cannabis sativa]|uniref:Uncharacterized protein n=2 Tax=Cannabis sativa TaxID=3483 RepID=A0A7J6G8J4_CANSA|nr:hypothetical protein F8388_022651 [Cannabis sativa]KAF4379301.1 hypothetical protein F8388_013519 [Cannabis sativa]KAF4398393.1 hypothetical protein G4B88_025372 [Cannabis sativa]